MGSLFMNYTNQLCAGCGKALDETSDVVVCPECGTPQHRECWMKENCCVSAMLHGDDYSWHPLPVEGVTDEEGEADDEGNKVCPICGEKLPEETDICPVCGLDFRRSFGDNGMPSGIEELRNTEVAGHKGSDLILYLRIGFRKYIPLFERFHNGGKSVSWNFGAFVFGAGWFFYRKINRVAVAVLAVSVAFSLLFMFQSKKYAQQMAPIQAELQEGNVSDERAEELAPQVYKATGPVLLTLTPIFVLHLLCGLFANKIYYRKVMKDFELASDPGLTFQQSKGLLAQRGGVSIFGGVVGVLASSYIPDAILTLKEKAPAIAEWFSQFGAK